MCCFSFTFWFCFPFWFVHILIVGSVFFFAHFLSLVRKTVQHSTESSSPSSSSAAVIWAWWVCFFTCCSKKCVSPWNLLLLAFDDVDRWLFIVSGHIWPYVSHIRVVFLFFFCSSVFLFMCFFEIRLNLCMYLSRNRQWSRPTKKKYKPKHKRLCFGWRQSSK